MRRVWSAAVVGACAVLLVACADDDPSGPSSSTVSDVAARDTVPTRAPEVSGRLALDVDGVHLAEASDIYYTDMTLLVPDREDQVLVVDEAGEPVAWDDLGDGMLVDVWVEDGCAESFPVQCDIEALRVDLAS